MKRKFKILIIEDDPAIRMALEDDFSFEGYETLSAKAGNTGLHLGMDPSVDLILLDIMLPEISGFDICKNLRKQKVHTPIIMLTAKGQEIDKVRGLEFGADDYVTKPYSSRELHARVKAQLRRTTREAPGQTNREREYSFADVVVNFDAHEVIKSGQLVVLTPSEYGILKCLIVHRGKVVTRDNLLDNVWGESVIVSPRTIDTHVGNLRKKIENNPSRPIWIKSVRGSGYIFRDHLT